MQNLTYLLIIKIGVNYQLQLQLSVIYMSPVSTVILTVLKISKSMRENNFFHKVTSVSTANEFGLLLNSTSVIVSRVPLNEIQKKQGAPQKKKILVYFQ